MARPEKLPKQPTGLYFARRYKGMSPAELSKSSGQALQDIARLEGKGEPSERRRLRADLAERFVKALGLSAEDILFFEKKYVRSYNSKTGHIVFDEERLKSLVRLGDRRASKKEVARSGAHLDSSDVLVDEPEIDADQPPMHQIRELESRAGMGGGGVPSREVIRRGRYADPVKPEGWQFPSSFLHGELRIPATRIIILETDGDSMTPTISSGERVAIDTGHTTPTPDGIYAIRDMFGSMVVKRLQVIRSTKPPRIKIISDNPNHPVEEVHLDDIVVVGRVLFGLKRY